MKNKLWKRSVTVLLANIILFASLPLNAYALPSNLKIENKSVTTNETAKAPADLLDGEVYAYSSATAKALPSTDFNISLSVLGQQYKTETITMRRFNIAFVLDVSNSMDDTRIANMVDSANGAIEKLSGNGNKIAIVSFANTPATERALSTKGLTLSQTAATNTSGTSDIIRISRRFDYYQGGTNIQSGLNAAYKLLRDANDPEAIPVIILLSDGAPTYYYNNVTDLKSDSSGVLGSGGSTTTNHVAYTIMQAAYLKTQMTNLQIYTIPFSLSTSDSSYDMATATLNPTSGNINEVSGLLSTLNTIKSSLPSAVQNAIVYNYPNGSYPAANSPDSLQGALNNIISSLKLNTPIAETKVNGVLNDASYVTMTYNIGAGFKLAENTMTVKLKGVSYVFTRHGDTYTYDVANTAPGYNPEMTKIVLTLSGATITWKVPASVLPCNSPEGSGQVLTTPMELGFVVQIDDTYAGLGAGTYNSSSSCTATYTPTADNPYYYSYAATEETVATNTTSTIQQTKYYEATYPYPGHDNYNKNDLPVLTGFGIGDSADAITYISSPSNAVVTGYSDYYNDSLDTMTVQYQGQAIEFDDVYYKEATAYFNTSDKNDYTKYTVTSFDDGYRDYDDARVIAASGGDVTISYDGDTKTIVFEDASMSYTYPKAKFKADNTSDPTALSQISINSFTIGSVTISSGYSLVSLTQTTNYKKNNFYTVTVLYNGATYIFNNVTFPKNSYTSSNITSSNGLYAATDDGEYYYFATASKTFSITQTNEGFRYSYNPATQMLTIQTNQNGVFATYASLAQGANTNIQATADGYIVTRTTIDDNGVKTVLVLTVTSTELTRRTSTTTTRNGVSASTGMVTKSLTNTGTITLSSAMTRLTITNTVSVAPGLTIPADQAENNFVFTLYTSSDGTTWNSQTITINGSGASGSIELSANSAYYIVAEQTEDYLISVTSGSAGSEDSPNYLSQDTTVAFTQVYAPVTLKSQAGSSTAAATSSGVAYVVLTFYAENDFHDLDIVLENDASTGNPTFSYMITDAVYTNDAGAKRSAMVNGALPNNLNAGTYQITLKTTITYPNAADKPSAYNVYFDGLSYLQSNDNQTVTIDHKSDYADQKVKIILITPSGH